MLYNFFHLDNYLTELGCPEVSTSDFKIIRRDLTIEEQAGNIDFKEDGIYLNIDGKEYKGYMYIKNAFIVNYDNKFPKFHITKCKVIEEQRASGRFEHRYYWHNSNLVDLVDAQTGHQFNSVTLELCQKCSEMAGISDYNTTDGFHELLDAQEENILNRDVEVGIFGYTLNWREISKQYRIEKDYTCENCSIKPENQSDRRYFHTHHKNGDKINNHRSNLECLCVLCHANKDATHLHNFDSNRMKNEINSFIKKYRNKLREVGNEYLDNFISF